VAKIHIFLYHIFLPTSIFLTTFSKPWNFEVVSKFISNLLNCYRKRF